jgi:HSP20 family protein
MAIERWQPFSELMSLRQAMDRLFEALDIYQTTSEIVVKAALPGLKPEDVSVDITGETLTIRGESKVQKESKKEDYLYQERRYGAFSRSVELPSGLKTDKSEAALDDGILTITIPKAEEVKPKKINVKAKEKK